MLTSADSFTKRFLWNLKLVDLIRDAYRALQVWPNAYGNAIGLRSTAKDKTLLDVRRGDTLHWIVGGRDERLTVSGMFISRNWPRFPETSRSLAAASSWNSIE